MINFNERVNLLVGNNGSGKSAILTALVVGLGCKASATNRSSNIKRKNESLVEIPFFYSINYVHRVDQTR